MKEWIITFNKGKGTMVIQLDGFFPCTVSTAKQLFKLAAEETQESAMLTVQEYFIKRICFLEEQLSTFANAYTASIDEYNAAKSLYETGKLPNGVPISLPFSYHNKIKMQTKKTQMNHDKKIFQSEKSKIKKLKRNLEILNEVLGVEQND